MTNEIDFANTDWAAIRHTDEAIARFVAKVAGQYRRPANERRAEPRYRMITPAVVQPMDDNFQLQGEAHGAITRDLSAHGVGILDVQPVRTPFVALELTAPDGERLQTIVEVLRCRRIGGFYDIGGRFMMSNHSADDRELVEAS